MKSYDVMIEGWIAGRYRRPEDGPIRLTDEDARYLVLNGVVREAAAKPVAKAKD